MTTTLCIDTASAGFALAVAADAAVQCSLQRASDQDHSRLLLPAIDEILADQAPLAGIVVVRGPGSYAGLRVGIATAEGLAIARGIPVVGVGTLDAVAAASGLEQCTAIHPGGRSRWAAQHFSNGRPSDAITAVSADELTGNLCGEGAGALGGKEVTPEERCVAALRIGIGLLATGRHAEVDAIYLHEPHITLPRAPGAGRHRR